MGALLYNFLIPQKMKYLQNTKGNKNKIALKNVISYNTLKKLITRLILNGKSNHEIKQV